jgi:hypothetical protein
MDLFGLSYRSVWLVQRLCLLCHCNRSLYRLVGYIERQGTMKTLIALIAIIMMASCGSTHPSIKNQQMSVKYSKYHQKGFKKASKRINAYNSEKSYGRR